jgi:hypothetical protein
MQVARLGLVLAVTGCLGASEGEPCGRDVSCVGPLVCVSTVVCAVGPCPGSCRAPCDDDQDCDPDRNCAAPDGWDPEGERFCMSAED